jgi:hypothetical protein
MRRGKNNSTKLLYHRHHGRVREINEIAFQHDMSLVYKVKVNAMKEANKLCMNITFNCVTLNISSFFYASIPFLSFFLFFFGCFLHSHSKKKCVQHLEKIKFFFLCCYVYIWKPIALSYFVLFLLSYYYTNRDD